MLSLWWGLQARAVLYAMKLIEPLLLSATSFQLDVIQSASPHDTQLAACLFHCPSWHEYLTSKARHLLIITSYLNVLLCLYLHAKQHDISRVFVL